MKDFEQLLQLFTLLEKGVNHPVYKIIGAEQPSPSCPPQ